MLAGKRFGILTFGTMAHSSIQAHESEAVAFERFAHVRPENLTLLIDAYDTETAARKVVALYPRCVHLDSGDLIALSRSERQILDEAGLTRVTIFASGGIDEDFLLAPVEASAPIDGFGIGTSLVTSADAPALDCAYKFQEYAGVPRRKLSAGKATWPGRKQVWRRYGQDGRMEGDTLALEGEDQPGEPLIEAVMRSGRRLRSSPLLAEIRGRAACDLARLPQPLRRLESGQPYPVVVAEALVRLAADASTAREVGSPRSTD